MDCGRSKVQMVWEVQSFFYRLDMLTLDPYSEFIWCCGFRYQCRRSIKIESLKLRRKLTHFLFFYDPVSTRFSLSCYFNDIHS